MAMKTIPMDTLPKCNFCDKEATYDGQTIYGSWAYMCESHKKQYGRGVCTKLEKRVKIAAPKTDEIPVVEIPLSLDDVAEVKCPHCGEPRAVEPDANYVVTCESCGNKYEVASQI